MPKTKRERKPKGPRLTIREEFLQPIPPIKAATKKYLGNEDSLEAFLSYFPPFALLTHDEEIYFARLAHSGDVLGRDRLIMHNLRLVVSETLKHYSPRMSDTTQAVIVICEGIFGLMSAIDRFDPEMGNRFSTYATHWVRRFIYRGSNELRFIRLPHYIQGILARSPAVERELSLQLGRDPTVDELADNLGERKSAYRLAMGASQNTNIIKPVPGLTGEFEGAGENYLDSCNCDPSLTDPLEDMIDDEEKEVLLQSIKRILSPREATVLRMRYGIGTTTHTLQEIGKKLKLSRERIRQIENQALDILKQHYRLKEMT